LPSLSRDFQIFVKPGGYQCNLACDYCYYLKKEELFGGGQALNMPLDLLERYIRQHIQASTGPVVNFSWHGGEPTILGLDYFRQIVALQQKHRPGHKRITNGMQTNGTLLNERWCKFLAKHGFSVGLSLDGPAKLHDRFRHTRGGGPSHAQVMRGWELLQKHQVATDILCVVNAVNVQRPLEVYRFFKEIGAGYLGFLPLVEPDPQRPGEATARSTPAKAFGGFLCSIFDEWAARDIGRVKVQIFEEAARTAFGQEHSLCIFRKTCGNIPVIEHNGEFYSCDHYVQPEYCLGNILERSLADMLDDPRQRAFGRAKAGNLPACCRSCPVLAMCNGGCPKNRFIKSPEGEPGLNYLCEGYKGFFTHCQPFVEAVASTWRRQGGATGQAPAAQPGAGGKAGRNDPCPCGSGRKYKKCCLKR
jgi:uncharacterized protein